MLGTLSHGQLPSTAAGAEGARQCPGELWACSVAGDVGTSQARVRAAPRSVSCARRAQVVFGLERAGKACADLAARA